MNHAKDESQTAENIFEELRAPIECVEDYVPGGLHPVHLGDEVGQYKILRKLGYGGYSTVWLAQDNREVDSFVALKIVRADSSCAKEIQHYDTLRANANRHPGASHIMMLTEHFIIHGPNGKHDCLAYEVLGPSVAKVLEDSSGMDTTPYLTLPAARKAIYQVLLGLDYMHSVGLVHGDVYSANVLFTVGDLSHEPLDMIRQPRSQVSSDVQRVKGPRQPGDPRHLTLDWPLNRFVSLRGDVKLSDLGNSFIYDKDSRDDDHILQLFSLLGPLTEELKQSWPRHDMYFDNDGRLQKFVVDDDAFSYLEPGNSLENDHDCVPEEVESDDQQQQSGEIIPDFPRNSIGKPQEFFNPDLYPQIITLRERKPYEAEDDPHTLAEFVSLYPPLPERWSLEKHPDMQPAESHLVLDFLQNLLTYDPDQRLPTKDLLQHAWIQTYCAPNDTSSTPSKGSAVKPEKKRKRSVTVDESE